MGKLHTHYDNLKVARDAPPEVIRAAYRTLTQKYHPDKNPGDPSAARVMTLLNQSYEVLSDPARRRKHDDWIASREANEESSSPRPQPRPAERKPAPRPAPEAKLRMPSHGYVRYADLYEPAQRILRDRVRDRLPDQLRIPLGQIRRNVTWALLVCLWFAFVIEEALNTRWTDDTGYVYAAVSAAAAIALSHNLRRILAWYRSPLRPSLIVTPLYVIQTGDDEIWYWPIHEARDFHGTQHFFNGSYRYTEMACSLSGRVHRFALKQRTAFNDFVRRLDRNLDRMRQAAYSRDQDYVDKNDEIRGATSAEERTRTGRFTRAAAHWGAACVASAIFSAVAIGANAYAPTNTASQYTQSPPIQAPQAYYQAPVETTTPDEPPLTTAPLTATPIQASAQPPAQMVLPAKVDYVELKLGRLPPTRASYVRGEPLRNSDGRSTVTVDNQQNDSDVLVKLVYVGSSNAYPARVFFIPAYSKFQVGDVTAGKYDIRYMDRWSGATNKSEPFELEEERVDGGVRYSEMTMTLYTVENGNMQFYPIPQDQF